MIKIFLGWVIGITLFLLAMGWAGKQDEDNCASKGRELNAPAQLVGSHCMVKGWGRVY